LALSDSVKQLIALLNKANAQPGTA
jgi:hypothetical protein